MTDDSQFSSGSVPVGQQPSPPSLRIVFQESRTKYFVLKASDPIPCQSAEVCPTTFGFVRQVI